MSRGLANRGFGVKYGLVEQGGLRGDILTNKTLRMGYLCMWPRHWGRDQISYVLIDEAKFSQQMQGNLPRRHQDLLNSPNQRIKALETLFNVPSHRFNTSMTPSNTTPSSSLVFCGSKPENEPIQTQNDRSLHVPLVDRSFWG